MTADGAALAESPSARPAPLGRCELRDLISLTLQVGVTILCLLL